jgi:hypothetical protein
MLLVFNVTFNNISTISWWSVLLVEAQWIITKSVIYITEVDFKKSDLVMLLVFNITINNISAIS